MTTPITRFTQVALVLGEVFDVALTPVKIAAYAEALQDLPIDALEPAAKYIIRTDGWFPKPARWREVTLEILRKQREAERMDRLQGHALPQDAGTPEELAAKAKSVIGDLASKMGWR